MVEELATIVQAGELSLFPVLSHPLLDDADQDKTSPMFLLSHASLDRERLLVTFSHLSSFHQPLGQGVLGLNIPLLLDLIWDGSLANGHQGLEVTDNFRRVLNLNIEVSKRSFSCNLSPFPPAPLPTTSTCQPCPLDHPTHHISSQHLLNCSTSSLICQASPTLEQPMD